MEFEQGKPTFNNPKIGDEFKNVPVIGAGIGNMFISGFNKIDKYPISVNELTTTTSTLYLLDNMYDNVVPSDPWSSTIVQFGTGATITKPTSFTWGSGYPALSSSQVKSTVLANSGSRPKDRHASSQRVIDDINQGKGQIIDCVKTSATCTNSFSGWPIFAQNPSNRIDSDNDGMPNDWETANGLNINVNDAALDKDNDGYTNIEEWLYSMAVAVG